MATVAVRCDGTTSPPAKTPASSVIMVVCTWTTPSSTAMSAPGPRGRGRCPGPAPGPASRHRAPRTRRWAPGTLRRRAASSRCTRWPPSTRSTVESQRMRDALGQGLVELVAVGGHALTVPPVDDDGVGGAEAPGRACRVERGVTAAVDGDPSSEQRVGRRRRHGGATRWRRGSGRESPAGMSRRRASWAPTATKTASKRAARRRSGSMSSTVCSSSTSTPRARIRSISASRTSRGRR